MMNQTLQRFVLVLLLVLMPVAVCAEAPPEDALYAFTQRYSSETPMVVGELYPALASQADSIIFIEMVGDYGPMPLLLPGGDPADYSFKAIRIALETPLDAYQRGDLLVPTYLEIIGYQRYGRLFAIEGDTIILQFIDENFQLTQVYERLLCDGNTMISTESRTDGPMLHIPFAEYQAGAPIATDTGFRPGMGCQVIVNWVGVVLAIKEANG